MQHAILDFLRPALIPELGSDVAAGTSRYEELILVAVAAVRAFPDQLAGVVGHDLDLTVVAAYLAVVALGVEFRVHDIVVDEFHLRDLLYKCTDTR